MNTNNLRAAELKNKFAVFGHFYQIQLGDEEIACRSVLEIIDHGLVPLDLSELAESEPDLLIVMMNPGSSRPLDKNVKPDTVSSWEDISKSRTWVTTQPDNTQYQIMRIMVALGSKHGRVLNLSDMREPKSPLMFKKSAHLAGVDGGGVHSIFSPERKTELEKLMGSEKRPVIVGWGRDEKLLPLAKQALERLDGWKIYGRPANSDKTLFAHPSPMLQKMKEQWVDEILLQMGK